MRYRTQYVLLALLLGMSFQTSAQTLATVAEVRKWADAIMGHVSAGNFAAAVDTNRNAVFAGEG